jgi:hypothetical protein
MMKRLILLFVLVFSLSILSFADIAKPTNSPKTKASIETEMMIHLRHDAKEARLLIPKSRLQQLRADLDGLDTGSDYAATTGSFGRTQTIVSGLFLSLAIVFGGLWFARSGKAATLSGKTLVVLTVLAGMAAAASFVYANAGPPPEARSITGKMFVQGVHIYGFGSGTVKLEVGDEDFVDLIVPDPKDDSKPAE